MSHDATQAPYRPQIFTFNPATPHCGAGSVSRRRRSPPALLGGRRPRDAGGWRRGGGNYAVSSASVEVGQSRDRDGTRVPPTQLIRNNTLAHDHGTWARFWDAAHDTPFPVLGCDSFLVSVLVCFFF